MQQEPSKDSFASKPSFGNEPFGGKRDYMQEPSNNNNLEAPSESEEYQDGDYEDDFD